MDVSFSANRWKLNEIQRIDLKLEQQFYASTPYNLNDFKQTSKPLCPLFKTLQSSLPEQKNSVKKELIKRQNISLAIFVTYLYQFLHQIINQIQKKNNSEKGKTKFFSQTYVKTQKTTIDDEAEKQSERRMISPQKKVKKQQFQVLKNLKLKIYEVDLCKLKNVPEKFTKYYNNNLLKKIIFQYLSKALQNISLVQILLQNNQVLCFALSLVSQSLLYRKQKISQFNEERRFYDQALAFLQHFDHLQNSTLMTVTKSSNALPQLLVQQFHNKNKIKSQEKLIDAEYFINFRLSMRQMKSKHSILKEQGFEKDKKYSLYLLNQQDNDNKKINSPNKNKEKAPRSSPKKIIPPNKAAVLKDEVKLKQAKKEYDCLKYFVCLRYFFSDSPRN